MARSVDGLRTGVSVPVVLLLDLGALLLGVEILIGNLLELDHFGGCVCVGGGLIEWRRLMRGLMGGGVVVSRRMRVITYLREVQLLAGYFSATSEHQMALDTG